MVDILIFTFVNVCGIKVEWLGIDKKVIFFNLDLIFELVAALKTESPSDTGIPENIIFHGDNYFMVLQFLGLYMGDFPIALYGKAKGTTSQKWQNEYNYWNIIHYPVTIYYQKYASADKKSQLKLNTLSLNKKGKHRNISVDLLDGGKGWCWFC